MRTFTVGDLQELLGERKGPCVSIFLPTHRRPDGTGEDRVRFRNLLDDARGKLEAVMPPRAVPRLVAQFEPLLEAEAWRGSLDGFAAFAAPGFERHFRVPVEMPERVVVADSFHVRPLIRVLQSHRRWYLLSLAATGAAFFEASPSGLTAKSVPGLPATPADAAIGPRERIGLSSHSAGNGRVVFHGGSGPRSEREDLARWFRAVDHAVCALLRDEHAPLVLAGVSRLTSIYRSVTRYPHVVAERVDGNVSRATPGRLFALAAPLAAAAMQDGEAAAVSEYQRLNGALRSSDDLDVIAVSATQGRVRRLLIARGRSVRGEFDRATGEVRGRAARQNAYGDDVLDDVACEVLLRGGAVLVVERDRMPTKSPVAAVMRW
jgi:hypothetical protein